MTDLAVRIAYRGDGFSGSQIQPGLRTVEGTLLSSLCRVLEMEPDDICLRMASRTDKGVNATGNVASFESDGADPVQLLKALNSIYGGVLCTAYARVGDDFFPRHADMRTYEYVLRSDSMDLGLANECLSLFRGRRDFAGFCKAEGKDTVIDRVASGRMPMSKVEEAVSGGWSNFGIAPAEGLTLTEVRYDGLEFIPSTDPALRIRRANGLYEAALTDRFYRNL